MAEWLRRLPAKQLGTARASSNLAAVEKRRWCSGNISDFHSEAPVSITGRRSTFFFYS